MNRASFQKGYRSLASTICGEFGDSVAHDDEGLARKIASEYPSEDRARHFEMLLSEAHRLMQDIDEHWEAVAKEANRRLYSRDAVRDWLIKIMTAWQEELTRLRGNSQINKPD